MAAEKLKVELQDENGNIYYLHTDASIVFCDDGTSVAAKLSNKMDTAKIINNGLTTEPGFALDARYGRTLQNQITQVNSDLGDKLTEVNARISPLYKSVNASHSAAQRNFVLSDYQNVHVIVDNTGINFIFPNKSMTAIVIVNVGTDAHQNGVILVTVRNERLVLTTLKSCTSSVTISQSNYTLGIILKNATGIVSCIV